MFNFRILYSSVKTVKSKPWHKPPTCIFIRLLLHLYLAVTICTTPNIQTYNKYAKKANQNLTILLFLSFVPFHLLIVDFQSIIINEHGLYFFYQIQAKYSAFINAKKTQYC